MKKRILALFLIILMLTLPGITGVFAASEPEQETDASTSEPVGTPETEPDTEAPEETPTTEAPEPVETEDLVPVATEEPEPPTTEEPEVTTESTEPQEFSDFEPDLDPTDTHPGREVAHGLVDPTEVRYRYYWVLRLHSADDGSFESIQAYILAEDGSDVFASEIDGQTEAIVSRPDDPVREHAEFLGWYTTEDCSDSSEFSFDADPVITSHTDLYAKWNVLRGMITIRRSLDSKESQSFWYSVEGDDGSLIRVAIPSGKDSVTISGVKIGVTYMVTERQSWSWRYSCDKQVQKVLLTDEKTSETLTFEGKKNVTKWLNSISQLIKTVKEG